MKKPIYLDNHATTQIDPRVLDAMMPYLTERYGNPSSRTHRYGWQAEEAIEHARDQVASLINADSNQIIFTSGATESNNMAIHNRGDDSVMSAIEHSSIKNTLNDLFVDEVNVGTDGIINLDHLKSLLYPLWDQHKDIMCVFAMMVNNEIGTIQPLKEISEMLPEYTWLHSDMAQALGKVKIDVQYLNVDSASLSSHKIYGPKGVGALYMKKPSKWMPFIYGGSQEFDLRSGTQNVAGIVGFGKACELLMEGPNPRIKALRNLLNDELKMLVPDISIHEFPNAIDNTLHMAIPCKNMDLFMSELEPNVSVSFGSACMSAHDAQSYVLKAIGIPEEEILRSIRIGIGRFNTEEEMIQTASYISEAVKITLEE